MLIDINVVKGISSNSPLILNSLKSLSIKGTIKEKEVPLPCRVRLFEKLSGQIISDIQTDNNGNYEFNHLNKTLFFIVAHHPESKFNAVIQDNIIPE